MVDDGTYQIRCQAGLLTDFDDLLVVLGDGDRGQTWTVTNSAEGTVTLQADTGQYLSLVERRGPFYNPGAEPEPWKLADDGGLVRAATGEVLAMSLIRVFPPAVVKTTDGPTMPLTWTFVKV